ncbi:MAG: PAS domain S-box protein [Pseudomonadota bacterium]
MLKTTQHDSRQLQGKFFGCTVGAVLLICTVVAVSSFFSFYGQLQESVRTRLLFDYTTQKGRIEQHLAKLQDIAAQVTSRTQIREALEAYNQGKISREKLVAFSLPKLQDAMNHSPVIAGINRFNPQKELLVQVGMAIPASEQFIPHDSLRQPSLFGPIASAESWYLVVGAPIINRDGERVGTDIILFNILQLEKIIQDFSAAEKTAEMIFVYKTAHQTHLISSLHADQKPELIDPGSSLGKTVQQAFSQKEGIVVADDDLAGGTGYVMSYGPVGTRDGWAIMIKMSQEQLYGKIKANARRVAAIIAGLIILGAFGLVLLLRPLSGKIIIHQGELEKEIEEKTRRLEHELNEHKKAEDALSHSQQLLLTILDGLEAIVYVCDLKSYEVLFINCYGKKIFGDISGRTCWQAMRTDLDGPCSYCPRERLQSEGNNRGSTLITEHFNTMNNRWYEHHDRMINWLDGRPVKLQIAMDITKRKEVQAALEESEERLRTLINATPDIICFKDGEGRWLEANNADLTLFALEGVDYRGHTDAELASFTHPVYRSAFLECEKSDENSWQKGMISRGEESIPTVNGDDKVLDVIKVPLFQEDGTRKGLVVLGRDISDRKKSEEKIKEYAATQKVLLREVNHRVKNNLSAIISMLHMEEDAIEKKDPSHTDSLHDLISRIQGLSTVHSLLSAAEWRPLSLEHLSREIITSVFSSVPAGKRIDFMVEESDITINSDQAHHLALVLSELATNTIKHALSERDSLQVALHIAKDEEGIIHLIFHDNGPGYPDEVIAGTLDRMHIGMEIVQGIISSNLHGRVTFGNDNGAVTRLSFVHFFSQNSEADNA